MGEMAKGLAKALIILAVILLVFSLLPKNNSTLEDIENLKFIYEEKDAIKEEESKIDHLELYEKVSYDLLQENFGSSFFNIYFEGEKFTNEFYLYTSVINLIKNDTKINCTLEKDINKVEVYSKIKEIFGNNVEFIDQSYENKNISIKYDEKTSNYHIKTNKCSEYDYKNGGIREEYYKTSKIGNIIYIYTKAMYVDYSNDENGSIIFNYHQGVSKNDITISNDISTINKDLLPTYRYVFEINGNNYYFKKVEEIK